MISAKDVQSGIRNKSKATTSILPYLKAEQQRKNKLEIAKGNDLEKENRKVLRDNLKSVHPLSTDKDIEDMINHTM